MKGKSISMNWETQVTKNCFYTKCVINVHTSDC